VYSSIKCCRVPWV